MSHYLVKRRQRHGAQLQALDDEIRTLEAMMASEKSAIQLRAELRAAKQAAKVKGTAPSKAKGTSSGSARSSRTK